MINGTSFAAPLVTAAAAIHATTLPSFDIEGVLCYLEASATPFEGASMGILNTSKIGPCAQSVSTTIGSISLTASNTIDRLTASPNPFMGELKLNLPSALDGEATSVRLLDANGKVFLERSTTNNSISLDTNSLPRGVYWVSVRNGKVNETTTVVRR